MPAWLAASNRLTASSPTALQRGVLLEDITRYGRAALMHWCNAEEVPMEERLKIGSGRGDW
ncbi:hypothetical protein RSPO_c00810 [Ralstonia solanacearum Po82]|uniref:Uncharacterized protein n=1 Tax=Ralstonia solanacearum (strain Po82) TaxID=1031711 RepID=F6FYM9_RALS8|nr:hypothetical protein RSPO_c00810 [Ralstonia solanacearum Po82]